jgi:hypothetical protein
VCCTLPFSAESKPAHPQVGLLAEREARKTAEPFHLPRSFQPSGIFENGNPHSQWRDRAGFAPDFPFITLAGHLRLQATTRAERESNTTLAVVAQQPDRTGSHVPMHGLLDRSSLAW